MQRKPRHPSEQPVRRDDRAKSLPYTRVPYDEPLTPGLRRRTGAPAIGFLARLSENADD